MNETASEKTSDQKPEEQSKRTVEDIVADHLDADVILYNGPIYRFQDTMFIKACIGRRRRKNVLFILVTEGGDADPTYRIARCLQNNYEFFSLYVSGYCKSAGTIVATGAHALIMSDHGELGPLDVQMSKKDELLEMQSGLTVMDTLAALQDNAFNSFEQFFLHTKVKSGGSITSRMASKIATEMATGLFAPLYSQVDPLHIGETARAMSIASHYGQRLLNKGRNIESVKLQTLTSQYPSHGFVIDRQEASLLFKRVREPNLDEALLAERLDEKALWPNSSDLNQPMFKFLNTERTATEDERNEEQTGGDNDTEAKEYTSSRPSDVAEDAPRQPAGSDSDGNAVTERGIALEKSDRK